jgi:hypothetical protein
LLAAAVRAAIILLNLLLAVVERALYVIHPVRCPAVLLLPWVAAVQAVAISHLVAMAQILCLMGLHRLAAVAALSLTIMTVKGVLTEVLAVAVPVVLVAVRVLPEEIMWEQVIFLSMTETKLKQVAAVAARVQLVVTARPMRLVAGQWAEMAVRGRQTS